jgi:hypothetical protein
MNKEMNRPSLVSNKNIILQKLKNLPVHKLDIMDASLFVSERSFVVTQIQKILLLLIYLID